MSKHKETVFEITANVKTEKGRIPRRGTRTMQIRRVKARNAAAAKKAAVEKLTAQRFTVVSAEVAVWSAR